MEGRYHTERRKSQYKRYKRLHVKTDGLLKALADGFESHETGAPSKEGYCWDSFHDQTRTAQILSLDVGLATGLERANGENYVETQDKKTNRNMHLAGAGASVRFVYFACR